MEKHDYSVLGSEDEFKIIGKEWMLVTAGGADEVNTMTASWGGMGWLWNKPGALHTRTDREQRPVLAVVLH